MSESLVVSELIRILRSDGLVLEEHKQFELELKLNQFNSSREMFVKGNFKCKQDTHSQLLRSVFAISRCFKLEHFLCIRCRQLEQEIFIPLTFTFLLQILQGFQKWGGWKFVYEVGQGGWKILNYQGN